MDETGLADDALREVLALSCGLNPRSGPLLGRPVDPTMADPCGRAAGQALAWLADPESMPPPAEPLRADIDEAVRVFRGVHADADGAHNLAAWCEESAAARDDEGRARAVTGLLLPELRMRDDEIIARWKLADLEAHPAPIRPDQVTIQVNALYTVPEDLPRDLPTDLRALGERARRDPGPRIADYDHPVALFAPGERHELVRFVGEFDRDLDFEKAQGALPPSWRVPLLISVSVTHRDLDEAADRWVRRQLTTLRPRNLRCLLLTEAEARRIRRDLLGCDAAVFTVSGRYGAHFTALKYAQLLLEKAWGVRAGFKLDTDEGVRSADLCAATGRTWFQTLCHPYWGGRARDWRGHDCVLGVNAGEYVNAGDIDQLGYAAAMRVPDVTPPTRHVGPDLFFHKGFAHGRATALYNRFTRVEEGISHPVVKGGGFGITNEGLRRATPFALSWVGRAEDQQFYASGIPGGCRAIFHPALRIAHYKSRGGVVAQAEEKTVASRLAGDLDRLLLFQEIVARLGVKDDLDPMPGAFAGPLARVQATLLLLARAHEASARAAPAMAAYLMKTALPDLRALKRSIDRGEVAEALARERDGWREFVARADALDPAAARRHCARHLEVR